MFVAFGRLMPYFAIVMGTEVGTFNGTDLINSVLPSIGSLKNERCQVSVLLNAPVAAAASLTVRLLKV